METAHSTYFTATSLLVSVLFVPSLHSYYFSRKFLFFSSIYREYLSLVPSMSIDREQEEEKRRDSYQSDTIPIINR